jgi:uncharacterized paraquat-inducible protein A
MLVIDFGMAVAMGMAVALAAVAVVWGFSRTQKEKESSLDPKHIRYCAICTYSYVNTHGEDITTCPRCGSYNKRY